VQTADGAGVGTDNEEIVGWEVQMRDDGASVQTTDGAGVGIDN
jgi:hypothetical protein